MIGVTSTGSHAMGVCSRDCQYHDLITVGMRTDLGRSEDVLDRLGDLGTNAITFDQADEVIALKCCQYVVNWREGLCRRGSIVALSDLHSPALRQDP